MASDEKFAIGISHHPVVFIDSNVDDYQNLVKGVIPQAEVIVLDTTEDGVTQITSALLGRTDISEIHIVSHGAPGCLYLGNTNLSLSSLEYYASQLSRWTASSLPLLLYGCNVAAGDAGAEFLEKLHDLTGAPITATATRTGNAAFGGTWQLEVSIGDFPAAFNESMGNQPKAFTATAQAAYRGIFGSTTRVSVASNGTLGDSGSTNPVISADGRFVAFTSSANNLVLRDTNNNGDIFVRDLQNGTTTRVSVANDGTQGTGFSSNPAISADGHFVAFTSNASNLVPGDTNNNSDVFVRDIQNGTTTRVSVANDGTQGTGFSSNPAISADGHFVAFTSSASNLVPGDTNGSSDIFVRDIQNGTTTRVSVANDGTQGNSSSSSPAISADGHFVAFTSSASNLVPGDTNGSNDVFERDLQNGTTTRVSVASDGTEANSGSSSNSKPAISADGRFVAFQSNATNLAPGDINNTTDVRSPSNSQIFVHDLLTGITTEVSVASDGTEANRSASNPAISADGRFVTFDSSASNLVAGDTNNFTQIFVRDLLTGTITLASPNDNGSRGNNNSSNADISGDGSFVAFQSTANNLVVGDSNSSTQIFVRDTGLTVGVGANNNNNNDLLGLTGDNTPATLVGVDTTILNQSNFAMI